MRCSTCNQPITYTTLSTGYKLYDIFPGNICITCHKKKMEGKPPEKPDFIKAINK